MSQLTEGKCFLCASFLSKPQKTFYFTFDGKKTRESKIATKREKNTKHDDHDDNKNKKDKQKATQEESRGQVSQQQRKRGQPAIIVT